MNSYKMKMSLVNLSDANDKQKDLLMLTKKENRMIPNMYRAMVNSPSLLDSYMHGYKKFRIESGFTPTEQEVVLLTISAENNCSYCMAAHSILADTVSKVPLEVRTFRVCKHYGK
jgi:AhpD family alkylhydroperoxidase